MTMPYIGVTDFTDRQQVSEAAACIPASTNRRLHVGAMMSYKTLNNIPTTTGWERIWLDQVGLHSLFIEDKSVFNVLHYADYDDKTTLVDLIRAIQLAGPGVEGLQLDMKWPTPSLLSNFKSVFPHIKIIQQIGHLAIKESHDWERDLAAYEGLVDYILLDCGMGKGVTFTSDYMLFLLSAALKYFDQDQVVVAGGLGPETYLNLKPVLELYPNVSCDAQGRLRHSRNAADPLDMVLVKKYITGVCSLIEK